MYEGNARARAWLLTSAVTLWLIGVAAFTPIFLTGSLSSIAPMSLMTVIPVFVVGGLVGGLLSSAIAGGMLGGVLGSAITPIVYVAVARYIRRSGRLMPKASVIAFTLVVFLSAAHAAHGWDMTVNETSPTRATGLLVQALGPPVLIALAGVALRNHLTVPRSLALHWVSLAWLSWSAFPWYGGWP